MNPHDVAHVDTSMVGVVLVCNCGHRSEQTSRAAATRQHEGHANVQRLRDENPGLSTDEKGEG